MLRIAVVEGGEGGEAGGAKRCAEAAASSVHPSSLPVFTLESRGDEEQVPPHCLPSNAVMLFLSFSECAPSSHCLVSPPSRRFNDYVLYCSLVCLRVLLLSRRGPPSHLLPSPIGFIFYFLFFHRWRRCGSLNLVCRALFSFSFLVSPPLRHFTLYRCKLSRFTLPFPTHPRPA